METENGLPIVFGISPENGDFNLKFVLEFLQELGSRFASESALAHKINNISYPRTIDISNDSFNFIISREGIIIWISSSVVIDVRADNCIRSKVWNNNLIRSIVSWYNLAWCNILISSWLKIGYNLIRSRLTRNKVICSSDNIGASIRSLVDNNLTTVKEVSSSSSGVQKLIKIVSIVKVNIVVSIESSAEFEVIIVVEEEGALEVLLIFLIKDGDFGGVIFIFLYLALGNINSIFVSIPSLGELFKIEIKISGATLDREPDGIPVVIFLSLAGISIKIEPGIGCEKQDA